MPLLQWFGRVLQRHSKRHSRKNLYEYLSNAIAQHCTGDQAVINVGAGGAISRQLEKHGLEFTSIDVDRERGPDLVMDVQDLQPLADGSVDVVFCCEVLEHVQEPLRATAELHRVLKEGGVVIGSTPFVFGIHDRPHDYYRFTRYGLLHLFRSFEPVLLRERNGYFEAVYVLCVRLFNIGTERQKRTAWCLAPLLVALWPLFRLLGLVLGTDDVTSGYFFVFRKPKTLQDRA